MSGPNQHHIPQSLLRAFGRRGRGTAVQVTVYTKDRRVFTTTTRGVGAERYFYSEPPVNDEAVTLDDQITAYEPKLASILTELQETALGCPVNAANVAEAVAHLCIRQAHLRDSFATAARRLLKATLDLFADRDRSRKALGLDSQTPNRLAQELIDEAYEKFRSQIDQRGIKRDQFQNLMFDALKGNSERMISANLPLIQMLLSDLHGQTKKMAREGHIRALEQTLAPQAYVDNLKEFKWRIKGGPAGSFVLPDCVAVGSSESTYQPLVYAGKKASAVYVPIGHDRLLMGSNENEAEHVPENMNLISATCSWKYFIALERRREFMKLAPRIGERTRQYIDDAIEAAIGKYE